MKKDNKESPNKEIIIKETKQFYRYITFAKKIAKYVPEMYFFITYSATNKALNLMMNKGIEPKEEKKINEIIQAFLEQLSKSGWDIRFMNKAKYDMFLEQHYSTIDWNKADLETLRLCNDLLDLLTTFGKLDKLAQQRKEYFNKKIEAKEKEEEELANKELLKELEQHLNDEEMEEEEYENKNEIVNINDDIAMEEKAATIQNIVPEDKPLEIQKPEEHKKNVESEKKVEKKETIEKTSITEEEYKEIEREILDNITKCDCELDFNNLDKSQKHIEEVILYLRKLTSI